MLFYNDNIRTKTTICHPIEFGKVLNNRQELYSFSEYSESKVVEVIFSEKQIVEYGYDSSNRLNSYCLYVFGKNFPIVKAEINFDYQAIGKEDIPDLQFVFHSVNLKGSKGNWSIGTYRKEAENKWKLTFSRVETFLGYNIFFEEKYDREIIKESSKYQWNYDHKDWEQVLALTHEYQYKQTYLEKAVNEIKNKGWNPNLVKELQDRFSK